MRQLHPTTINIATSNKYPKTILSHAWAEVFKYLASKQNHPKVFIKNPVHLGRYLRIVYNASIIRGCNFDVTKINKLSGEVQQGFNDSTVKIDHYFDDNYLFSDACSLYFKGVNIFPEIFSDQWRKYVPVESLEEIQRQVNKTLNK